MKRAIQLLASLALGGGFLVWAFWHVDLHALGAQLAAARPHWLAAAVGLAVSANVLRAWRWGVLLRPVCRLRFGRVFVLSSVGLTAIFALPLRLGELVRPLLLKQHHGVSVSAGLASVTVERALDGLMVTAVFFGGLALLGFAAPPVLVAAALFGALVFVSASLVLALAVWRPALAVGLVRGLLGRVSPRLADRVAEIMQAFATGLRAMRQPRLIAGVLAGTLVLWAANGLAMWVAAAAVGLDLPLGAAYLATGVLGVGIMLPAGPGFLGSFQAAVAVGLGLFGVGSTEAAAAGLVLYLVQVVVTGGMGAVILLGGRGVLVRAGDS